MDEFKPECAGKMNFYLAVVNDQVRDKEVDNPSIGLILCRGKNEVTVRYSLQDQGQPMAVSDYKVLPAAYASLLPSAEVLNRHLGPLRTPQSDQIEGPAHSSDSRSSPSKTPEDDGDDNDGMSGGP